ncbi:MAG: Coenzyme F420 hydrogenase/dehydrogenase, beta subunit C-terminal domain [Bacteroidaceae bacterium]|nr:Coenzyme F420 hydrogenase/dehydrogenase, beta subunit C-terminal domain [Bacteroidaceae bacterium]
MAYPVLPTSEACCGCGACSQVCRWDCISMERDKEGFLYPKVHTEVCKECGLCMRVCPSLKKETAKPHNGTPLHTFAAINPDECVRRESSSGGVFTLLAEQMAERGGVVFGAAFDKDWNVVHTRTDSKEGLRAFRGSKYVQSDTGQTFREAKELLEAGREVLFVGTPCQIMGLRGFLGKPYEGLLAVDFICHGVPSPAVWQWYLKRQARHYAKEHWTAWLRYWLRPLSLIRRVEFRNKEKGWKQYHFVLRVSQARQDMVYHENPYMRAFLKDVDLRPSCHHCFAKGGSSGSDITLADFWNVHRVVDGFDDDGGTSLVLVNTERGARVFDALECRKQEVVFEDAIQYNRAWAASYPANPDRCRFFEEYRNCFDSFIT